MLMVKPLRVLTVAMLATHLMVGCCWHHAHGCPDDAQRSAGDSPTTAETHSCPGDPSEHGSHGCHEPKCSFVASYRPVVNAMSVSWLGQTVVGILSDDPSFSEDFSASSRRLLAVDRLLSPVRLHLANQVLLI